MFWKWLLGKGITRKMRNQASSCLGTLLGHIPGAVTLLKYLKCWYQEWTMPQILLVPYQLSLMENRFSCPRPRDFNVRLQMCFSPGYFSSLTCLLPREACSADPPPPPTLVPLLRFIFPTVLATSWGNDSLQMHSVYRQPQENRSFVCGSAPRRPSGPEQMRHESLLSESMNE